MKKNHDKLAEKISPEEMIEALGRSGYLLEARVEEALVSEAFVVEANTFYPDPLTGKGRELDICAVSAEPIDPDTDGPDTIYSFVVCECSNNAQPMAFLAKDWASTPFDADKIHVSGMPDVVPGPGGSSTSVQATLDLYTFFHHFRTGRIATQYCTFQRKQKDAHEWMATHDADDHGSLSKLCDYIAWKKQQEALIWAPAHDVADEPISLSFYYPVLVLQNDLYEARQDAHGKVRISKADHVLFRQSYALPSAGDFLINVVRESALPVLLNKIEGDRQEAASRIRKLHRQDLRNAVEQLWGTRGHGKIPRPA